MKTKNFQIKEYSNFLSKKDCDLIIFNYKEILKSLPELDVQDYIRNKNIKSLKNKPLRTIGAKFLNSKGEIDRTQMTLNDSDVIAKKIKQKFSKITATPLENQEPILIAKYEKNQGLPEHTDNFPNFDLHKCRRTHSLIIYLSDCEGGETYFRLINKKIKPKKGLAIMWSNIENGELVSNTEHSSLPVIDGTKYVLVLWVREVKYGGPV